MLCLYVLSETFLLNCIFIEICLQMYLGLHIPHCTEHNYLCNFDLYLLFTRSSMNCVQMFKQLSDLSQNTTDILLCFIEKYNCLKSRRQFWKVSATFNTSSTKVWIYAKVSIYWTKNTKLPHECQSSPYWLVCRRASMFTSVGCKEQQTVSHPRCSRIADTNLAKPCCMHSTESEFYIMWTGMVFTLSLY